MRNSEPGISSPRGGIGVKPAGAARITGTGGFTLVEVITAFTILAIVASIVFTVVVGSSRRSRYLVRESNLRSAASAILGLMAEDLEGAFVIPGTAPFFQGDDGFSGDRPSDGVRLLTTSTLPIRPDELAGDVAEVSYALKEDEQERTALYRREQTPIAAPYDEGGADVEVSSKVTALNFRFFDGQEWVDTWDSQDKVNMTMAGKVPRRIEIELTMEDSDLSVTIKTQVAPPLAKAGGTEG